MAELADAQDSDSCPIIGGAGSSPVIRSRKTLDFSRVFLYTFIWKYLPILYISAFGAVPDDLEIEFNTCRRPTEEERKTLAQQITSSINEIYNSGLISQKTALKELRQSAENTGMWTNITDEDIEKASDETAFPTEDLTQPPSFYQYGEIGYEQKE